MGSRVANNAEVGVCTILNTNATVEHDCKVANFVHMAPSSTITGRVVIGECSFIGVGAVIYPDVRIPRESFIGGGAIVRKTLSEKGTLYGYDSMPTFRNIYDRKLT
jgi:acyl-[acyl carrier protein]--UDP-N-acetylglucosamine O-acyltransferase